MNGPRSHERKPGKQCKPLAVYYPASRAGVYTRCRFRLLGWNPKTPKAKGRPWRRRKIFYRSVTDPGDRVGAGEILQGYNFSRPAPSAVRNSAKLESF